MTSDQQHFDWLTRKLLKIHVNRVCSFWDITVAQSFEIPITRWWLITNESLVMEPLKFVAIYENSLSNKKWRRCNLKMKKFEISSTVSKIFLGHFTPLWFSLNDDIGCDEKNMQTFLKTENCAKSDFRNYPNCSERTHAEILKVIILRNLTKINIVFLTCYNTISRIQQKLHYKIRATGLTVPDVSFRSGQSARVIEYVQRNYVTNASLGSDLSPHRKDLEAWNIWLDRGKGE